METSMVGIYGQYCCRNDLCLTLESDGKQLSGLLGYSAGEIETVFHNSLLALADREAGEKLRQKLTEQLKMGDSVEMLFPLCHKDGTVIWALNRGHRVVGEEGQEYLCGILVDITLSKHLYDEQKQAEKKAVYALQEQAEKDALTMLLNARTARELAEEYLANAEDGYCALLIIDLDDFKHINDQHGHMFGDTVLEQSARTISQLFRSDDIVGRIGGDEFMVLMKNVSDRELVDKRCHQLVTSLHDVFCMSGYDCEISCSVGVVFSPARGMVYSELFRCADQALYQAKDRGKNQYVFGQTEAQAEI